MLICTCDAAGFRWNCDMAAIERILDTIYTEFDFVYDDDEFYGRV